jgi:single-strand DNA-binding protein
MANYNKVILVGNLTRDPQLTYLPSQMAVVEFGMAINRTWKGADGQKKEEVCFVDVRAYGKPAETINHYMAKGQQILIEGRLSYQQWQAQDGSKRSKHIVVAEAFQFMGGPGNGAGGAGRETDAGAAARPPIRTRGPQQGQGVANGTADQVPPPEEDVPQVGPEDDIPF